MTPSLTTELIADRINILEANYQAFIKSGEVRRMAEAFSSFHDFDEETAIYFENGLLFYLIFFLDDERFTNYLISDCFLNRDDAVLLVIAIKQALPDYIKEALAVTQKALTESTNETYNQNEDGDIENKTEELDNNDHNSSLENRPRATIEFPDNSQTNNFSDNEEIYQSSQDEILNRSQ